MGTLMALNGAVPSPSLVPETPRTEELSASWAILIMISVLFAILLISYYLQLKRIRFIHETLVSIILGATVGCIIRLSPGHGIQDFVKFDHTYFFNLLLPPIILNSGYDLKTDQFFRHIGSILTFAFVGTFISTLVIGGLVYCIALTRIHGLLLSFLDCLEFGAILSSTDPVTVLAIFHQVGVDPSLYAIIFGESILNDSVAIVLSGSISSLQKKTFTAGNAILGVLDFFAVFTGSVLIGITIALFAALLLKNSKLHYFPSLESCVISLLAYSSYILSNATEMSGIVSLLFCGMVMKHYCYENMSLRTKRTTKYMFRVLSQLSENFVFIYLGVNIFTMTDPYYPGLIFFTTIFIMIARYASTLPLAKLINWVQSRVSPEREPIPRNHQLMLLWSGLRGAIAFALSFGVESKAGPAIRTTTLIVCVISIMVLGGTTNYALSYLNIKTGFGQAGRPFKSTAEYFNEADETDSSDDGESELIDGGLDLSGVFVRRNSSGPGTTDSPLSFPEPSDNPRISNWFIGFDENYMKPFFTRKEWKYGVRRTRMNQKRANSSPTRENLLTETGSGRVFSLSPDQVDSPMRNFTSKQMDRNSDRGGGDDRSRSDHRKRQASSGTLQSEANSPAGSRRDVFFLNSKK